MNSDASVYRAFADRMTYREREIVKLMYGSDDPHSNMKCEDVAQVFNLRPSTVREIVRKLAKSLRAQLEAERAS